MRGGSVWIGIGVWLSACGPAAQQPTDGGPRGEVHYEQSEVGGAVVATVDGTPITLDEVRAAVRATGLSPEEALHRLETERALELRAHRAGLGSDEEVVAATRRAAVRALIARRVEAEITPQSVSQSDLDARYEVERFRFARPELRSSVHLRVSVPRDGADALPAAERFVRRALTRVLAAENPAAEAEAIGQEASEGRVFHASFEAVPPAAREGSLAEPFAEALFALPAPGVVPRVVATEYGFHVIVLTGIEASWEVPRDEAEAVLRRQIAVEQRAQRLMQIEDGLIEAAQPAIEEQARQRALTMPLDPVSGRP